MIFITKTAILIIQVEYFVYFLYNIIIILLQSPLTLLYCKNINKR